MEIVFNLSTANTSHQSVDESPISRVSQEENCFQASASSSGDDSNQKYLNELIQQKFNDATVIVSVVILVLINFATIAGNILVILSVFTSVKLRTVTNFFIGKRSHRLLSKTTLCILSNRARRWRPVAQFLWQWQTS